MTYQGEKGWCNSNAEEVCGIFFALFSSSLINRPISLFIADSGLISSYILLISSHDRC